MNQELTEPWVCFGMEFNWNSDAHLFASLQTLFLRPVVYYYIVLFHNRQYNKFFINKSLLLH
jgi:hypothetical protein